MPAALSHGPAEGAPTNGAWDGHAGAAPAVRMGWALASRVMLAMPAVAIASMAFSSGGYFPGAVGHGVVILLGFLALVVLLAPARVRRPSRVLLVFAGLLAAYGAWVLLSTRWSHAVGRSQVEVDRALLYLLAATAAGIAATSVARLRTMLELSTVALVLVSAAAVLARLLPDLVPTDLTAAPNRLSYPLGYWNALGMLTVLAAISCLHLSADLSTTAWKRCLAAAALPVPLTALVFTFSRGALLALVVATAIYVVAALSRGTGAAALAALPAALPMKAAYGAGALASLHPRTLEAIGEGGHVFIVMCGACALALVARCVLLLLDVELRRLSLPPRLVRAVVAAGVLMSIGALAVAAPGQVERIRNASRDQTRGDFADARTRLTSLGNAPRLGLWRVSLDDFRAHRLRGAGAGSFAASYAQRRSVPSESTEGHSLYAETLGELGLVGFLLIVGALLTGLVASIRPRGREARGVFALVLAGGLAWAIGAGYDWQWEIPAVTLWPLTALAAACGIRRRDERGWRWAPRWWVRIVPLVALAGLVPLPLALARSEHDLDRAVAELKARRPQQALESARSAERADGDRAEGYELEAYSLVEMRRPRPALRRAEEAVRRDPRYWEYRYAVAVARASAGLDPIRVTRDAAELNPQRVEVAALLKLSTRSRPRSATWRRLARRAPLIIGAGSSPLSGGWSIPRGSRPLGRVDLVAP